MPLSPAKLTRYRKRVGLTPAELASRVKTTTAHVLQLERGERLNNLSLHLAEQLARACRVRVDDLLDPAPDP